MPNSHQKSVFVLGAGIGGLATAALLAKKGYNVTVIEKNSFLGGRASIYEEKSFTFDKGPSWYMMPEVFDDYFALFGKKTSDYYKLTRLAVNYKVFFDSGSTYEIESDAAKNIQTFERAEKGAGKKLQKYLAESKYLYETSMKEMVFLDYSALTQLLNIPLILNAPRLKLFNSLHSLIAKYFKNKELQKILEFTTVFLGGSPYNTPAFYSLVSHADFNLGIYYPDGGMNKIPHALASLCQELGVKIIKNEPVTKLETKNGLISKITTSRSSYAPDIVVSNIDYRFTETTLLQPESQTYDESYWSKKTLSPSALIIYLGINKKLKNISHHNLYFNSSWEEHFKNVYSDKNWPKNPSYYVHAPSLTDKSVSPRGSETLMFLVPVAPGLNDSDEARNKTAQYVLEHFQGLIKENFMQNIIVKKIYSHRDFIYEYNSYKGSAFGISHTLMQTGPFRPLNKSKKVKNLFYAGQFTNPGVGVPPCLISARITAGLITKHHG